MEVIRMAANPVLLHCYTDYDPATEIWSGPPGTGLYIAWDLERRLNLSNRLVFAHKAAGTPQNDTVMDPITGRPTVHFNGIVGMLQSGDADWSPCTVKRTYLRALAVHYSSVPSRVGDFVMSLRVPPVGGSPGWSASLDSIFKPFTMAVWAVLISLIMMFAMLMTADNLLRITSSGNIFSTLIIESINALCPLLDRHMTPPRRRSTLSVILLLSWMLPSILIADDYAGEVTSFLATQPTGPVLIENWAAGLEAIDREEVMPQTLRGSWVIEQTEALFGLAVRDKLNIMKFNYDTFIDHLMHGGEPGRVPAWIGANVDQKPHFIRFGIHTYKHEDDAPPPPPASRSIYYVGEGEGVGSVFDGVVISRRRPDLSRRIQPLLQLYLEFGHFTHWDAVSVLEAEQFFSRSKPNMSESSTQEPDQPDGMLRLENFASCYLVYGIGLLLSTVFVSAEKAKSRFSLSADQ